MALENRELDNYIPLIVCQEFAKYFFEGFKNLYTDIGLDKTN